MSLKNKHKTQRAQKCRWSWIQNQITYSNSDSVFSVKVWDIWGKMADVYSLTILILWLRERFKKNYLLCRRFHIASTPREPCCASQSLTLRYIHTPHQIKRETARSLFAKTSPNPRGSTRALCLLLGASSSDMIWTTFNPSVVCTCTTSWYMCQRSSHGYLLQPAGHENPARFCKPTGPGTACAGEWRCWTQPGAGDRNTRTISSSTRSVRLFSSARASDWIKGLNLTRYFLYMYIKTLEFKECGTAFSQGQEIAFSL